MSNEGEADEPMTTGEGESDDNSEVVDRETAVQKLDDDETDEGGAPEEIDTDRSAKDVATDDDLDLERRAEHIDQREMGLDKRAEDLDEREAALDEREVELDERHEKLAEKRNSLEKREERISEREAELDEREVAIEEREAGLDEAEAELDEKDQTIRQYVGDQVGEAVEERISAALEEVAEADHAGRFGPTGGLLVGLTGLALVVGGVALALATQAANLSTPLASTTANVIVSALLIVVGLGANLAAATDRL